MRMSDGGSSISILHMSRKYRYLVNRFRHLLASAHFFNINLVEDRYSTLLVW